MAPTCGPTHCYRGCLALLSCHSAQEDLEVAESPGPLPSLLLRAWLVARAEEVDESWRTTGCLQTLAGRPGLGVSPVLSLSQKVGVGTFFLCWSGLMLDLCSLCREAATHQTTPVRLPGDQPAPTSDPHPWRGWRLYPPLLLRRSSLPLSPTGAISRDT